MKAEEMQPQRPRDGPEKRTDPPAPSQETIALRAWKIHVLRERPLTQWQAEWPEDCRQAERELWEAAAASLRRTAIGPGALRDEAGAQLNDPPRPV